MGGLRLLIGLIAVALLVPAGTSTAIAAKGKPRSYVPKKGAPCKKGYKAKKRGQKRICVKRRQKKQVRADAGVPRFQVNFDAVGRDPLNPFRVSYSFSASATRVFSSPVPREVPEALPPGVISFFVDGSLKCALNVGGANPGGQCTVLYPALGDHAATLVYTSGETSVSRSTVSQIAPLSTTTDLTVGFRPASSEEVEVGFVGRLDITGRVSPAGTAQMGCSQDDPAACIDFIPYYYAGCCGHTGYRLPLAGTTHTFSVGMRDARFGVCFHEPEWEISATDPAGNHLGLGGGSEWAEWDSVAPVLAAGERRLMAAASVGNGYLGSGATAPVQFVPQVPPDPCAGKYGALSFDYENLSDEPPALEEGLTRVGTLQVIRDPSEMNVYCTIAAAVQLGPDCIPYAVEELAVFVSAPNQSDCGTLHFSTANPDEDPGVAFTASRTGVEAGAAYFYGRGEGRWATGAMQFAPLIPEECT